MTRTSQLTFWLAILGIAMLPLLNAEIAFARGSTLIHNNPQVLEWMEIQVPGMANDVSVYDVERKGNSLIIGTKESGLFQSTDSGTAWERPNELADSYVRDVWMESPTGAVAVAATIGNGLFRRANSNTPWEPVSGDPSTMSVYCVSGSGNTIYAGTVEGGIWKSGDGGLSWQSTGQIDSPGTLSLAATTDRIIYAGSVSNGVFMTTDGAVNWSQLAFSGKTIRALGIDPEDPELVIASVLGDGVMRSTDSGKNWTELEDGIYGLNVFSIEVFNVQDQRYVLAGTDGRGVFRLVKDRWQSFGLSDLTVYSLSYSDGMIHAGTNRGAWQIPLDQIYPQTSILAQLANMSDSLPDAQVRLLHEFLIDRGPRMLADMSILDIQLIVGFSAMLSVIMAYVLPVRRFDLRWSRSFVRQILFFQFVSILIIGAVKVLVWLMPNSIVFFLGVSSIFQLHPKGFSYVLRLVQFGSRLVSLNCAITIALAVTFFAHNLTRKIDDQATQLPVRANERNLEHE